MKRKQAMKKNKRIFYLLIVLYSVLFIFTFIMQWISVRNPNLRWIINGSTLLLGLIAGTLFYLLYQINHKDIYIYFAVAYILTKRETQIGYLVFSGYTNQQIAEELYISETTVKKHLTHIYEKTQVSGRKELNSKIKNYEKDS